MVVAEKSAETSSENSKIQETFLNVTEGYNKHLPTDRFTFNFRVPVIGFVLSLCTFDVVDTILFENFTSLSKGFYIFGFFSLAAAYLLHYGLKIGDRKQYSPWILLKIVEVPLIFATVIVGCTEYRFHIYWGYLFYGFIILFLNAGVTYYIIQKSVRQFRSPKPLSHPDDEAIYDNA